MDKHQSSDNALNAAFVHKDESIPKEEMILVDGAAVDEAPGVDFGIDINVQQPILSIAPKVMEQAKKMNRAQRRKFMQDVRKQFKETQKKMKNITAHAQAKAKEAPAIAEEQNA